MKDLVILQLQQHDEEIRDWSEPICGRQEPQRFTYCVYRGDWNNQVGRVSVQSLGMSDACVSTTDRGSRETIGGRSRRVVPSTHRRQVVRVGDERVRLRRFPRILLAPAHRRETDQEGDRTPATRVEETSRNPTRDSEAESVARKDNDMLGSTGSQQSGSAEELCGMQSVSIRDRVNRCIYFHFTFICYYLRTSKHY